MFYGVLMIVKIISQIYRTYKQGERIWECFVAKPVDVYGCCQLQKFWTNHIVDYQICM